MFKRSATILLTLILLMSSLGIWLLFPLLQGFYRLKAHHAVEYQPTELVTLRLKPTEFKRVGNDEIEYKKLRYDIENEKFINGVYEFSVYPDYLETQLLSFFDETWQSISGEASEPLSPVSQFIQKMLSTDHFCVWIFFDFRAVFAKNIASIFSYLLPSFWAYATSLTPPPEG